MKKILKRLKSRPRGYFLPILQQHKTSQWARLFQHMNKYGPDDSLVFKEEASLSENVLKPHCAKPEGKLA